MDKLIEESLKLQGSLLDFTQTFYYLRTKRPFNLSEPISRESHFITVCKALTRVLNGETTRLVINIPPRYGKTELLIHFVAWSLAQYPDSNYIYVSYAHHLAKKQTQTIKNIVTMKQYKDLFGVRLRDDTQAKDNFETTEGGSIYGVGAGGSITGRGAGINRSNRFGGCIVIDDIHKPDEATSDTIREGINEWYYNTLQSRLNSISTPIIFIGQRVHEDDLAGHVLLKDEKWERVVLPALDGANNALYPELHDVKTLHEMQDVSPYNFASQYQQDPQPAGGGIFKPDWFVVTADEPEIITSFITVDTAETDKDYNDATVFSHFGLYKIKLGDIETDMFGLHWLDCWEIRIEPKDLENEFFNFYRSCMLHKSKISSILIERKSTGVTLYSSLRAMQGLPVRDIVRTKASGSKVARFLEIQPYVASKRISLPQYGNHTETCIEHMRKITANNSHRHDDICDTLYDAVKYSLIDKTYTGYLSQAQVGNDKRGAIISEKLRAINKIKGYDTYIRWPDRSPFG